MASLNHRWKRACVVGGSGYVGSQLVKLLLEKSYAVNTTVGDAGYAASKTLAEKAAWKFAEENKIDLVTIIPSLVAGPSLTPDIPTSIHLDMSLITGYEYPGNGLKGVQVRSGSISISHVVDVCRAHIYLAEKESTSGRYICYAANNTTVPELAKFLDKRYPQ